MLCIEISFFNCYTYEAVSCLCAAEVANPAETILFFCLASGYLAEADVRLKNSH